MMRTLTPPPIEADDEILTVAYAKDAAELAARCQDLRRRILLGCPYDAFTLAHHIVKRLWESMRLLGGVVPEEPAHIRAITAADYFLYDEHGRRDLEGAIAAFHRAIDTVVEWCEQVGTGAHTVQAVKKRRGRKPPSPDQVAERQELVADWHHYKNGNYGQKKDFCADRGLSLKDFNRQLAAHRTQYRRDQAANGARTN
jgi:hypothetical protein